ncbi:MAG: ferredoxin--NADP reductase [Chloroflexi bacterium]|nr:ferredoxin--NADP reductase [Chloroflexota bacterium]MCI0829517.1 ferredoxin--NADP reductase [Chloroflexota bacterium]MCI0903597.1 ferredoxin--NADP reductase [Chloroflexota bacterium]
MVEATTKGPAGAPDLTPNPAFPKASLVERRDVTEDLMVIKLEPSEKFDFKPGQYCTLGLGKIERAYSIVSAPYEKYLEIFVELVPEGELTPLMWDLKVGDCMSVRPRAKGIFTMDRKMHHHFMLSTVTGLAPSMSMVRQYLHDGGPEGDDGQHVFYIMYGASYVDELTYDVELNELAKKYPDTVKFVPTISRPTEARNAGWEGVTGRVNTIAEEYLQRFNLPKDDTRVYACGHPGMIEDVKAKFVPQGWNFIEERFWKP